MFQKGLEFIRKAVRKKMTNKCKCRTCVHVRITQDEKGWNRITCKYSPNKEFLGNYCDEPLNELCGQYKQVTSKLKKDFLIYR